MVHISFTIRQLSRRAVLVASCVCALTAGTTMAAQLAPNTIPGVVPHQAPLQPLPQGTAPNISNNIVQSSETGVPDSAATVEQGQLTPGEGPESPAGNNARVVQPISIDTHATPVARYVVIAGVIILILLVFGWYLWRQRPVHSSTVK